MIHDPRALFDACRANITNLASMKIAYTFEHESTAAGIAQHLQMHEVMRGVVSHKAFKAFPSEIQASI